MEIIFNKSFASELYTRVSKQFFFTNKNTQLEYIKKPWIFLTSGSAFGESSH